MLTPQGYKVLLQGYDIPLAASFIEAMPEAVKNSRDLVISALEAAMETGRRPTACNSGK